METEIHVPVGSPTIRKIPIHVDEHNVKDGAMRLIKELRPSWDIKFVQIKVSWGVFLSSSDDLLSLNQMNEFGSSKRIDSYVL